MYICLDLHTYIHYMNMNMCVPTRLTRDDFDIITDKGRLLNEDGEFDRLGALGPESPLDTPHVSTLTECAMVPKIVPDCATVSSER